MAKMKHTPGPWWLVESGSVLRIMGPRKNCTANGVRPAWEMAKIDNEAFWDEPGTEDEDRANARLIAAAPEMLDALKAASERLNTMAALTGCQSDDEWVWAAQKQVNDIIAKAEGRS